MKIIEIGFPQPLNNMVINKGQLVIYRATHYDTHCPNKNTQCSFQWVSQLNKWYASNLCTHLTKSR